ncbi:MAG: YfhO family protein [Chloroflexi bacterium]|nr:YfhO family protein [Chloroflexota bacterium]MDA8186952.1 YfhO family protein [Dehalococcoidales bacterium]
MAPLIPRVLIEKIDGLFFGAAWRKDLLALCVLLLLSLIYFKNGIVDGQIYFEPDTTSFYYPVMSSVDSALGRNTIPLWTPYIFGGYPLFADGEGGMLYPFNLLLLWLLPAQQALVWSMVIRFFLAGAFTYAYLRTLARSRMAALASGIVFAFSSFMVIQLHHTNVTNSAIWLPAILFSVELALQSRGPRRLFFLLCSGLAVGIQCLGVHVQPVLLTMFALSLYVPFRVLFTDVALDSPGLRKKDTALSGEQPRLAKLRVGWEKLRPKLSLLALVLAIVPTVGLGIAAIQLLPLQELGAFSFRGHGVSYWFATRFSLPLQNLITLIFPYFFRKADGSTWSLWIQWESTVYVGIFPLILALLAVIWVRKKLVAFYAFLALASLLFAFGDYLPVKLYWLVWQLPGFDVLRVPSRFTYLFVFSAAVLAGFGLDWLGGQLARSDRTAKSLRHVSNRWLVGLLSAIAAFFILLVAGLWDAREWVLNDKQGIIELLKTSYITMRNENWWGLSPESIYNALRLTLDPSNPKTAQPLAALALIFVILLLWFRFRSQSNLWKGAVVVLIAADLMSFALQFHPTITWDTLAGASGPTRFLAENNGLHRVYNRYTGKRTEPNRLLPFKIAIAGGYSSLEMERHKNFVKAIEKGNTRLLDLWNVRYIVSRSGQPPLSPSYPVVFQEGDVVIYENTNYLPRIFVVDAATMVDSNEAALDKVEDKGFDPRSVVVLEGRREDSRVAKPSLPYAVASAAGQTSSSTERRPAVDVVSYQREDVMVHADAPRESFLVITDSFYPGWKAYVDGEEAKMYRADYLFRSVFLPPGSHTVEFVFRPLTFEIGRNISVVTLVLVLSSCALLFYQVRRRA